MLNKPKLSLALVGVLVLGACAQSGVVVSRVDYAFQYEPAEISAAGGGDRQMKVSVLGNPFGAPAEAVEASVIESMQGRTFGIPVNFSANPENPDPSRAYHVVLAFNPKGIRTPGELCKAGEGMTFVNPDPETTTLMGAFCSSHSYLSHAIARADAVAGPGSEQLDGLVAQLTLALFPSDNPNRQDEGDTGVRPN